MRKAEIHIDVNSDYGKMECGFHTLYNFLMGDEHKMVIGHDIDGTEAFLISYDTEGDYTSNIEVIALYEGREEIYAVGAENGVFAELLGMLKAIADTKSRFVFLPKQENKNENTDT